MTTTEVASIAVEAPTSDRPLLPSDSAGSRVDDALPRRPYGDDHIRVVLDADDVQDRAAPHLGQLADLLLVRHLHQLALDHVAYLAGRSRRHIRSRLPDRVVRRSVREEQDAADHIARSLRHPVLDVVSDRWARKARSTSSS